MPRAIGLSTQKCAWSNLDTPSLIFPNLDWPDLEEIFLVRREMAALFSFMAGQIVILCSSSITIFNPQIVNACKMHAVQLIVLIWVLGL